MKSYDTGCPAKKENRSVQIIHCLGFSFFDRSLVGWFVSWFGSLVRCFISMFVSFFVFVLFLEGGGGGGEESLSLTSKDLHHVQVLFSEFSS